METQEETNKSPRVLFFSGGTALNSIISFLKRDLKCSTYVIPTSDNGGSTAEVIRVLGGPAIGDIRSRLIRLADENSPESRAVQTLLQYRLSASNAKYEWFNIVEGSHELWQGISEPYKETIRMFLVYFNTEVMKRQQFHSDARKRNPFDWSNGSVGNFFFTGARIFFNSLEAAIFWFSRVSGIPNETLVIPVISNNDESNIGAELEDDTRILGQNSISHPNFAHLPTSPNSRIVQSTYEYPFFLSNASNVVDKTMEVPLPSPIRRIFYLNVDGNEIHPTVNPVVIQSIMKQDAIVYSMGSLFTSIIPCLILKGVGEAIAESRAKKIFILNGHLDRETFGMTANTFLQAISNALNRGKMEYPVDRFVSHLFYAEGTNIPIETDQIEKQWGIKVTPIPSQLVGGKTYYQEDALCSILKSHVDSK